jgi:NADPH2:quinone reductase
MTIKMKAAALTAPGGPQALQTSDVEMPWPGSGRDVLVRLRTASLNPADAYFRAFGPYIENGGPCILGHDGAGIVEQVGNEVQLVEPGQRVCFCNGGIGGKYGTYAEFAVVPESQLAIVPDSVDDATAAALPLVFITGWEALYDRAQVEAGESVLIHAGAGGTGHIAIQLAALRGARVATTVSTDEKIELVKSLGAERPIAYRAEDFAEASRAWTRGQGLDVALDNLGADAFSKTIPLMAPYGRMVTLMGTPGDDENETAYINNLSIHNVMMLTPMLLDMQKQLDNQAQIVRQGLQLIEQGKLRVVIDSTFRLDEIAAAHERLDAGRATGKIVLSISE